MRFLKILALCLCLGLVGWTIQSIARLTDAPLDLTANKGAGQILLYLIVLAGVGVFTKFVWKSSIRNAIRRYRESGRKPLDGFLLTASTTVAVNLCFYALLLRLGGFSWSSSAWNQLNGKTLEATLIALVIVIVLASTEEIIFRGFLYNYLRSSRSRFVRIGAVFGSATIFALAHEFHTMNAWLSTRNLGLLVGLILLGILLSVTYEATGSLACSAGVHAALVWGNVVWERTSLLTINQSYWWMGVNKDLRTAPIVWLFFAVMTLFVWWARPFLQERVGIERKKTDFRRSGIQATES